jgi:hypothetical protein
MGTIIDLSLRKEELVAENMFLCQQLIGLERKVKYPKLTQRDRQILVLSRSEFTPGGISDGGEARHAHWQCPDHMLILGERHLYRLIDDYVTPNLVRVLISVFRCDRP